MYSQGFSVVKQILIGASCLLLVACGEELSVDDEQGQEAAIASETPFAYVTRDWGEADRATYSTSANAFNPGARLMVRNQVSSEGTDNELLAGVFGEGGYDVKHLNVSPDGKKLIFSAHGGADSSNNTWNLFE